jgi:Flp pilus assembly pilin Flp
MHAQIRRWLGLDDEHGQGLAEYAVIIGIIAIVVIVVLALMGGQVSAILSTGSGGV